MPSAARIIVARWREADSEKRKKESSSGAGIGDVKAYQTVWRHQRGVRARGRTIAQMFRHIRAHNVLINRDDVDDKRAILSRRKPLCGRLRRKEGVWHARCGRLVIDWNRTTERLDRKSSGADRSDLIDHFAQRSSRDRCIDKKRKRERCKHGPWPPLEGDLVRRNVSGPLKVFQVEACPFSEEKRPGRVAW